MQEIYEPAIVIDLRNFRIHPAEWYQTWNVRQIDEKSPYGLWNKIQELKQACDFKWGNSIARLRHISGGNTFKFAINKDKCTFVFMVWDDVRGLVVDRSYIPDDDGLIPQSVINEISRELTRWTKGLTDCRECGSEMRWIDSHGMYFDSRYCSEKCASKNARSEQDRSR